jgi:glyoxylate/hydroxypyruvate reductase
VVAQLGRKPGRAQEPPTGDDKPMSLVFLALPPFPDFVMVLEGWYRLLLAESAPPGEAAQACVLLVPGLRTVTAELLDRLPTLELMATISTRLDNVDLDACHHRGIVVTNTSGVFSVDSADYAVGLVIAVLCRVAAADAYIRRGRWAADGDYPLTTKVVLLIDLSINFCWFMLNSFYLVPDPRY